MRKLSYNRLRRENNQALKKYEAFGVRLFQDTLQKQAVDFDSNLMLDAYIRFYQNVFVDAATRQFNQIREENRKDFIPDGFFLATWRAFIAEYVRTNLRTIVNNVNNRSLLLIESATAKAIELGLNPFQTADLIKDTVGSRARALAIAKTESTRANNQGLERSAIDWGNETGSEIWKVWIHGGSKEPRIEHINLTRNEPIRRDEVFPIGGGMTKPGDLSAPPEQTINCSCFCQYLSENYIRRFHPDLV